RRGGSMPIRSSYEREEGEAAPAESAPPAESTPPAEGAPGPRRARDVSRFAGRGVSKHTHPRLPAVRAGPWDERAYACKCASGGEARVLLIEMGWRSTPCVERARDGEVKVTSST